FLREKERVTGLVLERWSQPGTDRQVVARETVRADRIVLAAGRGNAALVRAAAGWGMPTFTSVHQVPDLRNSAANDFAQRRYTVGPPGARREVELIDAPTISHWRDIYFRAEGSGMIFGTHHRELQADDYQPRGGEIGGLRVGLDQVMIDTLLDVMPHF